MLQLFVRFVNDYASHAPHIVQAKIKDLSRHFHEWLSSLPDILQWNQDNISIWKVQSHLSAPVVMWCVYSRNLCDLYSIGIPSPRTSQDLSGSPLEILETFKDYFRLSYHHAQQIAVIINTVLQYGTEALADAWMWSHAYESSKIMLYYLTKANVPTTKVGQQELATAMPLLQGNLEALRRMIPMFSSAQKCVCPPTYA